MEKRGSEFSISRVLYSFGMSRNHLSRIAISDNLKRPTQLLGEQP